MGKTLTGRVGMIARFKPLHLGQSIILETICKQTDEFIIGLGSSNEYNVRNPFTPKETKGMIDAFLSDRFSNYSIVEVPDLYDGPKWRSQALKLFGDLDYFVSANDYVRSLLQNDYKLVYPLDIIPVEGRTPVTGTSVRVALAQGNIAKTRNTRTPLLSTQASFGSKINFLDYGWKDLVPDSTANYLEQNNLDTRFCKEFGLETLAKYASSVVGGEK